MAWFNVYVKSRKMDSIKIACFTVALTIKRTDAVSSNGKQKKTSRFYMISMTLCLLFHTSIDIQSTVPERLSPVM